MLRKFLLTAGIAVGVFGLSIGLGIAVSKLWGTENTVGNYTVGVCLLHGFLPGSDCLPGRCYRQHSVCRQVSDRKNENQTRLAEVPYPYCN